MSFEQKIVKDFESGVSIRSLAKRYRVSERCVEVILRVCK